MSFTEHRCYYHHDDTTTRWQCTQSLGHADSGDPANHGPWEPTPLPGPCPRSLHPHGAPEARQCLEYAGHPGEWHSDGIMGWSDHGERRYA